MNDKTTSLLVTDGASRGNPGPAASAYLLFRDGREIASCVTYLGKETNNVAEYTALRDGLSAALKLGLQKITILSDSELVVRQLNGQYRVKKPHLQILYREVTDILQEFSSWSISHVPRQNRFIRMADALCNQELDLH
ncbi:MAG: ribonuclease HI family protein [Methanospirillaceae archaeon]|nr:ribonuclease HI family protein [Methanospirillaceae archaeon]